MKYFFALTFLLPAIVLAHGSGITFEKTVGLYFIDIGYDKEQFEINTPGRFDFGLWDQDLDNIQNIPFDSVAVKILRKEETVSDEVVFDGLVATAPLGYSGMVTTFSKPGGYILNVNFFNEGQSIIAEEFPFVVNEPEEGNKPLSNSVWAMIGTLLFLAGLILGGVLRKWKVI